MSRDHSAVADAARGCARLRRLEGELIERALSKRTELQKTRDLKRTKGAMTAPGQERGTADTADFTAAPLPKKCPGRAKAQPVCRDERRARLHSTTSASGAPEGRGFHRAARRDIWERFLRREPRRDAIIRA